MKKVFFLISLLILIFSALNSQTYILSGVVTDEQTGDPLIGATVSSMNNPELGTTTDIDGSYKIELQKEDAGLEVDYLGYDKTIILISYDYTEQRQDVTLSQSNLILETTTITGSRYEKSLAKSVVSMNVIKPKLIESTNTTIVDKLLDRIPGVQMIDGQANIRGGSGYSYGAGSRVLLLIDDVPAFHSMESSISELAMPLLNQ